MTSMPCQSRPNRRALQRNFRSRFRGFTISELMVTIAILLLLAGLIVGATFKLRGDAREKQTRGMLGMLKAVADEYEIQAAGKKVPDLAGRVGGDYRYIDWSTNKAYNNPEIESAGPGMLRYRFGSNSAWSSTSSAPAFQGKVLSPIDDTIERFVWVILQNDETSTMLYSLGKDFVADVDSDGFLDVVDAFELRGTDRQKIVYSARVDHAPQDASFTQDDYLPEFPRPFFASPGRDGTFGSTDDLFSYKLE